MIKYYQNLRSFVVVLLQMTLLSCNDDMDLGENIYCIEGKCIAQVKAVEVTDGDELILAGYLTDTDGTTPEDFWVAKTTKDQQVVWNRNYLAGYSGGASAVHLAGNGDYIVTGEVYGSEVGHGDEDILVLRLNPDGEVLWKITLGGSRRDQAKDIIETVEGDIVLAGQSQSRDFDLTKNNGRADCWIVKLDSKGRILWNKIYGGSGYESISQIVETDDGGFIIAASSSSDNDGDVTGNFGSSDYWILKLNAIGELEWQQSYGGFSGDYASSIVSSPDGGYVIAGSSSSDDGQIDKNEGYGDSWVIKIDNQGNLEWKHSYGWSATDGAGSVILTSDNGYLVTGHTAYPIQSSGEHHGDLDILAIKLDTTGALDWYKILGGQGRDESLNIKELEDHNILISAKNSSGGNYLSFYKISLNGELVE